MAIAKARALEALNGLGLEFQPGAGLNLGDRFTHAAPNGLVLTASATFEGGSFTEPPNRDSYEHVDFSLDSVGTHYRCMSAEAIESHGTQIVSALEQLARQPERLKCPKCKIRPVHLKEPYPGANWKPFLSCAGMTIVGRGRDKHVECDGVQRGIPALIKYA